MFLLRIVLIFFIISSIFHIHAATPYQSSIKNSESLSSQTNVPSSTPLIQNNASQPAQNFDQTSVIVLDTAWKKQIKTNFLHNVAYLEEIVTQGEAPQEVSDFIQRFNNQKNWFDRTLTATTALTDPTYYQLEQKTIILDNIVTAQKIVEQQLKQEAFNSIKVPSEYKKLRLNALYEINSFIQQKSKNGVAALATTQLTPQEIDHIVAKILQEAKQVPTPREALDLTHTDKTLPITPMQKTIDTLTTYAQEQKKERCLAQSKAALIEELADRRIQETTAQLKKQHLIDKEKLMRKQQQKAPLLKNLTTQRSNEKNEKMKREILEQELEVRIQQERLHHKL